jgi:heat shock protein HspQ
MVVRPRILLRPTGSGERCAVLCRGLHGGTGNWGFDTVRLAKFHIGDVVRHRIYPFRGVIFDVDPVFSNTEEWMEAIPEDRRPVRDQPFYHLLAENSETTYVAYVSEQNLLQDDSGDPVSHPQISEIFFGIEDGRYVMRHLQIN